MRPHRAEAEPLAGVDSSTIRFRHLGGARNLTDLCEASVISALPEYVLIEKLGERLSITLPLTNDPTVPFVTVMNIAGLRPE